MVLKWKYNLQYWFRVETIKPVNMARVFKQTCDHGCLWVTRVRDRDWFSQWKYKINPCYNYTSGSEPAFLLCYMVVTVNRVRDRDRI